MPTFLRVRLSLIASACALCACTAKESGEKIPLASASPSAATAGSTTENGAVPPAAQAALAAGNDLYRAGKYDSALTQYSRAVAGAPVSAAPYYGVLMVAQKTGNKSLADSASMMIRRLSGEEASSHGATAIAGHPGDVGTPSPLSPHVTPHGALAGPTSK